MHVALHLNISILTDTPTIFEPAGSVPLPFFRRRLAWGRHYFLVQSILILR